MQQKQSRGAGHVLLLLYTIIAAVIGLVLVYLGWRLLSVGGSAYYAVMGIAILIFAGLLALHRRLAIWVFAAMAVATLVWGLWEAGWDGWALVPRYNLLIVMGLVLWALQAPVRRLTTRNGTTITRMAYGLATGGISLLMLAVLLIPLFDNPYVETASADSVSSRPRQNYGSRTIDGTNGQVAAANDAGSWTAYGGSNLAQKFAPSGQITPANAGKLEQAWEFHTGDMPPEGSTLNWAGESTPLMIGRTLYTCSPTGQVFALDAATGKEKWRFDPKTDAKALENNGIVICRGVSYYQAPQALAQCGARIVWGTMDSRLLAVDAQTGEPCRDFGDNGQVDLTEGIGPTVPGFVAVTSPPAIVDGVAIVGHKISDGQDYRAPSGVVRGFDAVTGKIRWVWDLARPGVNTPPAEGEQYRYGTPNVWTLISADEGLGLVYVGTGNASGDFYGAKRSKEDDEFNSAVVALDVKTGAVRWHFQTVHHDIWDFDIGPQPTLTDWQTPGGPRPAIIQATKSGMIFVLDRETGAPLMPVQEIPVPTKAGVPNERVAPTQPISPGMPNTVGAPGKDFETLTEASTWGISPFDQALCRIHFRKMRYEGLFTPPALGEGSIGYPGNHGGMNWGGLSVDPDRGIMVINTERLPYQIFLIPRDETKGAKSIFQNSGHRPKIMPQIGLPYGAVKRPWMSGLNLPCIAPPYGYLAAIDMRTQDILWRRPLGTGYDQGPMGIKSHIKLEMGTPSDSGAMTTAGGVTFIGAAMDNFMRAFDTQTGKLLWEQRVDAGTGATPMSYELDGRQYVVAYIGGNGSMGTKIGDGVVAWALPAQ
ncbi:membrane-bound PQQ-dependent dehydrogenase, glucose/quinate/shikimate family [Pollutimonas bauzanensis]|uniref:Quinoprotein glucose dehydrogenase n=1 Tax=Pollutimonas bauzanensis TaxID=658167 RepID=A0A1M5PXR5_9BURK|nr:membrane-bound PQQ-dependent dehydrogenase, glucose/quinate/shikimate family [Pollutimonas bauzanensis]SHH06817.1 quinoprotein glucose dehydrogenase [Pollutimonas bauzanensis]